MSKTQRKNDGKGLAGHGVRNETAIAAWNRKAGPMQDRRKERGGARNKQREFLRDNDD
jgi:hypothetical protein